MSIKRFNPTCAASGLTLALGSGTSSAPVVTMTDMDRIRLAMHVLPLLYVTMLITLCAVLLRRRDVFLAGVIGASLASLIPGPVVYTDYSSVEGAVMVTYSDIYSHSLSYGSVGALVGSVAAVCSVHLASARNSPMPSNVAPSK